MLPFCLAGGHHGAVPDHRAVLPGQLRQHSAAMHGTESEIGSCGQKGLTLSPHPAETVSRHLDNPTAPGCTVLFGPCERGAGLR